MRKSAEKKSPDEHTKAQFLTLRDEWIDYVNRCTDLSHATARIGTFIALRMNAGDQASWWKVERIAMELDCSASTVSLAIKALVKEHLLVVHRKSRRSNQRYFIRLPYASRYDDRITE